MRINKCSVPGCEDKLSKRHRFPNPKINLPLFLVWIRNVENDKLSTYEPSRVYKSFYICNIHFEAEYVVPGTKRGLSILAVPTLHLAADELVQIIPAEPEPILQVTPINDLFECFDEPNSAKLGNKSENSHNISQNGPQNKIGSLKESVYNPKILKSVSITRSAHLTPRCKTFYERIKQQAKQLSNAKNAGNHFRRRLALAEKTSFRETQLLQLNKATVIFIKQQLKNQLKSPKSRRFTLEEKILSLTMLKASNKGYTLLSKLFCLPSRKTLMSMLNNVRLRPGININYFNCLKNMVSKMSKRNKHCIVMFDEISLTPNLTLNRRHDIVDGFHNLGDLQSAEIADTANVFMIKGISRQWKQPICFTFSSGPMRSNALAKEIVSVIKECQKIGLKVVATICDQGAGNTAAIRSLVKKSRDNSIRKGEEYRKVGFLVGGKEIVPLYDVPHLIKGIRNNLLNKDLHFVNKTGNTVVAKWAHVIQLYRLDKSTHMRNTLTEQHVLPAKINKMKVRLATQVFSHKVGALMRTIAGSNVQNGMLSGEAKHTADLILFLDELFDSLNGSNISAPRTKPLKGAITKKSRHFLFYSETAKRISKMKFYCNRKKRFVTVPSLTNFITTINNFKYLATNLLNGVVNYLLPRGFNQDPIENFFGLLRSHGVRNNSPDVSHFITSFKSLLLNNLMARHSPGANCERDVTVGLIDNMTALLLEKQADIVENEDESSYDMVPIKETFIDKNIVAYIAGYVAKKLNKDNCEKCSNFLLIEGGKTKFCEFIYARQYKNCLFLIPSLALFNCTGLCLSYLYGSLPKLVFKKNVTKNLTGILNQKVHLGNKQCETHNLKFEIINLLKKCILLNYIKDVNGIMSGKYIEKFKNTKDCIKIIAYKKFNKRQKKK